VYFVAGNAICRMVRIHNSAVEAGRLRCAAPPSGGSIDNLELLKTGAVDFAVVQSDWQYHAYEGSSQFNGQPQKYLRSVLSLHVEPFQIVVGAKLGINNWQDLDGKRVNIGNVGSGHRATFEELVRIHGQSMSRFKAVSDLGSSDQASALCDGKIDAFAFTVGVPNASIAQATDGCDGRIIPLETPAVDALIEKAGYYRWTTIPEGTYFTSTETIRTLGVVATLVTRADVEDETVGRLAAAVLENFDRFRRLHPAFANLKQAEMASVGLSAPLHPGARKYFVNAKILPK
jgi:TRAP transporter TAXI family solute receptor